MRVKTGWREKIANGFSTKRILSKSFSPFQKSIFLQVRKITVRMKHANTANWTISKLPKYRGHWGARNILPEGLFEAFESQMERRRRRAGGRRVRAQTIAISSSKTPSPSD